MGEKRLKIDLGAVEETLIIPLWARAKDAEKKDPVLNDTHAKVILERIDYDFEKLETGYLENHHLVWTVRAYNFDNCVRNFLSHNNNSAVINIGAGLDTAFQRIDDGRVLWINIELPDVANLRQKLIPDSLREITVARSVFDFAWMEDIADRIEGRSLLFIAAGVLCYFDVSQVKTLFCKLSSAYPDAHAVFDAMSRFTVWFSNREIIKRGGMDPSARIKWHLKKAARLKKWASSIVIVEEFPMFSRAPIKKDWSKKLIRDVKIAGRLHLYNMVHIRL